MLFHHKKLFVIPLLLVVSVALSGCLQVTSTERSDKELSNYKQIQLDYWGVWDTQGAFNGISEAYSALHPNVKIRYKKLRYDEYEQELLEAFAEGRGPDILSLHSTWLPRYQQKLTAIPPTTTTAYVSETGQIKKEQVVSFQTKNSITPAQVKERYLDVVSKNVILDGEIYALPLSVDTMVLFYNRDLFNAAGINKVPRYWNDDFLKAVKDLTREDENGNIIQSGVALGTSRNIQRYADILSLLMMQNGVEMMSDSGSVTFHRRPSGSERDYNPAQEALRFYTDFANPLKEVYNWNAEMPDSLQAFVEGRVAMFFGYSYHIDQIKTQSPRLNFGISPMLQIKGNSEINYANYWVEAVSAQSKNSEAAWDFIQFASSAQVAQIYLADAHKPTALRELVSEQQTDDELSVFANQLLTATNWYRGKGYNAAEVIIGEMIDQALLNPNNIIQSLNLAGSKVQQTIK